MKHVPRHIFTDNRYGSPQLFAIMAYSWNIHAVGTCKANIKGFDSEELNPDNNCEHGTFIILCDRIMGLFIMWCKDCIVLHTVSTFMLKSDGIINCSKGSEHYMRYP